MTSIRSVRPFQLVLVLALLLAALGLWAFAEETGMAAMKRLVRLRFKSVDQLSTADLQRWLASPERAQPLLLDVRTAPEFAMSHLPGAIRVDPAASVEELRRTVPLERPIVTYCSVGYRSSALAQKLTSAGAKSVQNLEGSIFQWASEKRPLEANGQPATKVHPYNSTFAKLLDPQLRGATSAPAK